MSDGDDPSESAAAWLAGGGEMASVSGDWTGPRRRSVPPPPGRRVSAAPSASCCPPRRRSACSGARSSSSSTTMPTFLCSDDEREVVTMRLERGQGQATRLRRRAGLLGAAEIAERPEPALALHATGGLTDDAEHAADPARLVAHRIVGDVEERLLREAATVEMEGVIGRPERLTRRDDALEQRPEDVPDLAPHLATGMAEHARMLASEHRNVGIVVELDELRALEQADLRLGGQQDADGAAETLRPGGGGTERRRGPVQAPETLAHLAPARQPRRRRLGWIVAVAHSSRCWITGTAHGAR